MPPVSFYNRQYLSPAFQIASDSAMEGNRSAQTICADKIGDGLLIYFDDGRRQDWGSTRHRFFAPPCLSPSRSRAWTLTKNSRLSSLESADKLSILDASERQMRTSQTTECRCRSCANRDAHVQRSFGPSAALPDRCYRSQKRQPTYL